MNATADEVLIFDTPTQEVDHSDEYCVSLGGEILEKIAAASGEPDAQALREDSWASVNVGGRPAIEVSIIWINESSTQFTWALQFTTKRGCTGLFFPERSPSREEESVRQKFFTAAEALPEISDPRWISDKEFREIY